MMLNRTRAILCHMALIALFLSTTPSFAMSKVPKNTCASHIQTLSDNLWLETLGFAKLSLDGLNTDASASAKTIKRMLRDAGISSVARIFNQGEKFVIIGFGDNPKSPKTLAVDISRSSTALKYWEVLSLYSALDKSGISDAAAFFPTSVTSQQGKSTITGETLRVEVQVKTALTTIIYEVHSQITKEKLSEGIVEVSMHCDWE